MRLSTTYSSIDSTRHSSTISVYRSSNTFILAIKVSITCNYLLSKAYSLKHYSATYRAYSRIICSTFKNRVSSIGSLRLRPYVMFGLLANMAVQQTASLAIGSNSFQITRRINTLQRCSQSMRDQPRDSWSYLPKVTVSITMPLASLQTTLATIRSKADWAIRQSLSSLGQIFLRTKNPRTKACIFLNRDSPSLFTISFTSNPLFGSSWDLWAKGRQRESSDTFGFFSAAAGDLVLLAGRDCYPAIAKSDRLFLFYLYIKL